MSSFFRAPNRSGPWQRMGEMYAAGLFATYGLILLLNRTAPSLTDYANWTYQGVLMHRHLLGFSDAAHLLKSYPVPNSAATVGIGLLCFVLPWKLASDVWLCLQLGVSFVALRHIMQTTGGSAGLWVVAPTALFLNVNFWYGFVNFELGLCWVLLLTSILLRRQRIGCDKREWVLGALLLIAFFTHMIPFCFCGLLLLLYAVQTARWRVLWQVVPAGVVSVWYVLARFLVAGDADGKAGMAETVRNYLPAFWAFKANSYLKSFGFVNPQGGDASLFGRPIFALLFVVNLVLCLAVGWAMVRAVRYAFADKAGERFVWGAILLVLPLCLLLPGAALGVSDPGARLLQSALAPALMLCAKGSRSAVRVAAGCAGVLAAMGLWLFAGFAFGATEPASGDLSLPPAIVEFAHVPNNDQDYFYAALDRGEMGLRVFPTGMFLNAK